ncbi:hypothetical protein MNBD_NITROSPINAE02-1724 [hydrothermal vent metagenome]|uniref:Uncharacterized protein n=1 Tax=hydrothermal vent metagenome TaxID=652676 RepID=A0A3B1BVB9_9ZZZZ
MVKAGVIGVGHMGQYHVGVISEMPGVELAAIVDKDESRVAPIAKKYLTEYYTDYHDLFDKVDLVTIAVPTSRHYEIARECLLAGLHCLVEKPISDDLGQAEELFEIADKKDLALHVGHVERFNGAVQELRKVVCDPFLIESRRLGPFDSRIQDDGVVLDLMIHDIDIILNLVESPVKKLNVIGSSIFTEKEDVVNVQIVFENGCMANIIASRATQEKIRTLAITQEKEYVVLNYTNQDILVHHRASSKSELTRQELRYKQEALIERIFVHRENPLKLEIKHFMDCATNGAKRHTSIENELKSLKVALNVLSQLEPVNRRILAQSSI